MPISYKNKIYTTLGTPTALSGNVVSATNSAGVPAKDYTVKGKTIVWNQMVENPDFSNTAVDTRTYVNFRVQQVESPHATFYESELSEPGLVSAIFEITVSGNCRIKHNGAQYDIDFYFFDSVKDHKYYICFNFTSTNPTVAGGIAYDKAQIFDLTQMFGAGNEPATAAQFRAMFPDDYYPYNAGELKSIAPTSVEAGGINLLNLVGRKEITSDTVGYRRPTDAYPEIDTHVYYRGVSANGYLSVNTVAEATVLSSSVIVKTGTVAGSNGYGVGIPLTVVPGTTYYIKCTTSGVIGVGFANLNKVITTFLFTLQSNKFTTPIDCRYALVVFKPNALDTLATFENICVSTVQTNEYQPYNKYRANIPSSKYFPDGMKSAGSVYDEINFLSQKAIKRIGAVDMGTLNWSWESEVQRFYAPVPNLANIGTVREGNVLSSKFITDLTTKAGDNWKGFSYSGIVYVYTTEYTDAAAFKAAMSGVMLYYELATPVETAITPPLQTLHTFKGFTSFSAPNSLTQNGPLSVTYYAEGGANPEKGWLTSYKRKLYMGRNIEWNQLLDKSKYPATTTINGVTFTNNGDGSIAVNGTATDISGFLLFSPYTDSLIPGHKYLISGSPNDASTNAYIQCYDNINREWLRDTGGGGIAIFQKVVGPNENPFIRIRIAGGYTANNLVFKPQLFDLTQMFGAGNEPATPEEFWSYFDHKLYPYNPGETQPLFKISRKSRGGG